MIDTRFVATREAWHRLAEHVLAAGQYHDTGEIELRVAAGGFETAHALSGGRRLRVAGNELVVIDGNGVLAAPLTTLAAAAESAGVVLGMPASMYPPATPIDADARLEIDAESAGVLAAWYELADTALRRYAADGGAAVTPVVWPEHFDIGITIGAVNFGASPGDGEISKPYAYVGPHAGPPARDPFWNAPFAAARTMDEIPSADAAVVFFREGHDRLAENVAAG